jgi:hypothetical protein
MESAEKQTQLSRSFHRPPLGNLAKTARFPHSHNADDDSLSPKTKTTPLLRSGRPLQLNSLKVGHFRWPKWARARGQTHVAVVFTKRRGDALPATWNGLSVIDGDLHDCRFLDPTGVVVGLRAKETAKEAQSPFVVLAA